MCAGFTGIDQQYEEPDHPEAELRAGETSIDECVQQVVKLLQQNVGRALTQFYYISCYLACDWLKTGALFETTLERYILPLCVKNVVYC